MCSATLRSRRGSPLSTLLRLADISDPILVGHSDGASIAIIAAGMGLSARALVLEAPHVFTEEGGLESIAKVRDLYSRSDLRARLSRWHDDVDVAFHGWNGAWLHPEFKQWNLEAYLPSISSPILMIQGLGDEYGSEAQLRAIARGAGGPTETVLLPACGHSPHKDKPEETLQAMAGFLRRVL